MKRDGFFDASMLPRRHGGADDGPEPRYDFSTNANALGPNPAVLEAIRNTDLSRYPEPTYRELRVWLADDLGVSPEAVVVGAGVSELIFRLVGLLGGPVLTQPPTFGEYALAAGAMGQEVQKARDPAAFLRLLPGAALAFLCVPNNPTGEVLDDTFLQRAASVAARSGTVLALDLAYLPLSEVTVVLPDSALLLFSPNKAHGLTGIRAGYARVPDPDLAGALRNRAPSWVLGALGAAFLGASLSPEARRWLSRTVPRLHAWRRSLARGLADLGYPVIEGKANFLMARLGRAAAERLRRQGIRVRPLGDKGLPAWARLAALGPVAQAALFDVLRGEG